MSSESKAMSSSESKVMSSSESKSVSSSESKSMSSSESKSMSSSDSKAVSSSESKDLTSVVAEHYNQLEEKGLAERTRSRIFHMRNFNNWIKSMLIGEFIKKVKDNLEKSGAEKKIRVLDIGAGKGGDLLKWKKGNIHHLVCADIAATSLDQCQERYNDMMDRDRRQHYNNSPFTIECHSADCTKARLKDMYKDPEIQFNIVSCQFSFHYCFESLQQAQCMIRNASESLKPGGYFIGTTPDAYDIVRRLRLSDSLSFGNEIFSATFTSKDDIPLFGAQYQFHLEGVVDCPEFLVYFPAFVELASQAGLKLLFCERFEDFFERHMKTDEGRSLLTNMQALQSYSGQSNSKEDSEKKEFLHADKYIEEHNLKESETQSPERDRRSRWPPRVGTLSQQEWDAISIYVAFAFVKEGGESNMDQEKGLDDKEFEDKGRKDKGRDDKGRDDKVRDDKGRDDKVRDDKGRDDKGRDDKGHDDKGRDDKGRDDKGRDDKELDDDSSSS